MDGWQHLYSVAATGGEPLLLTPGRFMVEYARLTPDRQAIVYNANTGTDPDDDDRWHLFRVPVDAARPQALTSGSGVEWGAVVTGDGASVAFLSGDTRRPPLPQVMPFAGGAVRRLGEERIPSDFPSAEFVEPRKVVFKAADGTEIHGQLFGARSSDSTLWPALVFVHGGPIRQMLLGFHYMQYYARAYAMNQYYASHGFVVLAVNYRLGIGYGNALEYPANPMKAPEYQDVFAAALHLRQVPNVDPHRIGIWGGSYGGYLTALALARNSDVFAAGVDWHGVHDLTKYWDDAPHGFEKPADRDAALQEAWKSSPVADIARWKSPVLLVAGDDDRNVEIAQTVDLVQRLDAAGVRYEQLLLPDEIHDFLRYATWLRVEQASAEFLERELGRPRQ